MTDENKIKVEVSSRNYGKTALRDYQVEAIEAVERHDVSSLFAMPYGKSRVGRVMFAGDGADNHIDAIDRALNNSLNVKMTSEAGATLLAAWARAHGAVLNMAHKELMLRHGIDITGIIFSEPIPMDFGTAEDRLIAYYAESGTITADEFKSSLQQYPQIIGRGIRMHPEHLSTAPTDGNLETQSIYVPHTGTHQGRGPKGGAEQRLAKRRAKNKAARKARRHA